MKFEDCKHEGDPEYGYSTGGYHRIPGPWIGGRKRPDFYEPYTELKCKHCGCEGITVKHTGTFWKDPVTGELLEGD